MRKLSILVIAALLLALVPGAAAQDDDSMMMGPDVIVTLAATPFAEGAGLASVTGWAHVVSDDAHIHIALEPNGATLPDGAVLEGWVVDAGLNGGPGVSNVTDDDELYGTPFGDADFDQAVEAAPYALSTGVLTPTDEGTWEVIFDVPGYNFSPYDAVVVTLESDGDDLMGFDPRPGTPVFAGAIADGEPSDSMMMDDDMGGDMMGEGDDMSGDMMGDDMMGMYTEVALAPTPLAEGAGLGMASGTALVDVEHATIEITVILGEDAMMADGAVFEGWVVDAGLNGGPGISHVTDDDEVYGVPFGEAAFDDLVESAPYALSTGVLHDNMDGTLTLTFHVPGYNFSPYDAVVITLESDGDTTGGFDPRPGTPVLAGEIGGMMGDDM